MERSLDARAVVFGKSPDAMRHVIEVFARDGRIGKVNGAVRKASFGTAAQVQNDFNEIFEVRLLAKRSRQVWRHHLKQEIEVIRDFFPWHLVT
jgi:hypothetical protein